MRTLRKTRRRSGDGGGGDVGEDMLVAPGTVSISVAVPAPTVSAASAVAPSAIAITMAVPAPTVYTTTDPQVSPVAITITIPAPTVTTSAAVTPASVDLAIAVPAPTVAAAAQVAPAAIGVTLAVPDPTVYGATPVTPASVDITLAVPTPTVTAGSAITPASVALTLAVPTPQVVGGAAVTPSSVALTLTVEDPDVSVGGGGFEPTGTIIAEELLDESYENTTGKFYFANSGGLDVLDPEDAYRLAIYFTDDPSGILAQVTDGDQLVMYADGDYDEILAAWEVGPFSGLEGFPVNLFVFEVLFDNVPGGDITEDGEYGFRLYHQA